MLAQKYLELLGQMKSDLASPVAERLPGKRYSYA